MASLKIKRLYWFMLKTFLPLFMMTFCICLFIVMMQFLWKYIDELVGKGLGVDLIAELFFYAALSMVPLALPLSILLASLMTFGNLGEHFELTAMKSSGISLLKVMKPLTVFIAMVSVGAFFFQNDVLPQSQVKMWTLLFSMRQKSPTLDIPEGAIYSQIPGYNLYVKQKNPENNMLYGVLIYDVSTTSTYPRIVVADSGMLSMDPSKTHLVLLLHHGNWYEDLSPDATMSNELGSDMYRREAFKNKEIIIPYDDNFNRMNDETMRQQYIGKNITELRQTIDSVSARVDSVGDLVSKELMSMPAVGVPSMRLDRNGDSLVTIPVRPVEMTRVIDFDSLMATQTSYVQQSVTSQAISNLKMNKQNYEFKNYMTEEDRFIIRRHEIELQKKFTLSLACLIFFFIGAPLGAIIRKGGLGTPIVISVLLFIVYYVIDNMGYKLAREGRWQVWQGIWLSSAVLLPLGIFLTHKAVNDSAVFNPDAYRNFFRRLLGLHQTRHLELKEVIIEEVENSVAQSRVAALKEQCEQFLARYKSRQGYLAYFQNGYDKQQLDSLSQEIESVVDYLSNSRDQLLLNKAMDFPILRKMLTYHITNYKHVGTALAVLFPIGVPLYLVGTWHQTNLKKEVATASKVCDEITQILNSNQEDENQ
ncbi:MAG: LptF/LptG family permease [Muribaculaceae bacterium]|nr:LptF/LptG family permease [Muribaculaceae bacterium]